MVVVFTDGGCSGNPGPGAWAYAIYRDNQLLATSSGGDKLTTNNKMELTAAIEAIRFCLNSNLEEIEIRTDSQYVKNGITSWINGWKRNGWKNSAKQSVKNQELWQELDRLASSLPLRWTWVKGHAGIDGNELCDQMVKAEFSKLM